MPEDLPEGYLVLVGEPGSERRALVDACLEAAHASAAGGVRARELISILVYDALQDEVVSRLFEVFWTALEEYRNRDTDPQSVEEILRSVGL